MHAILSRNHRAFDRRRRDSEVPTKRILIAVYHQESDSGKALRHFSLSFASVKKTIGGRRLLDWTIEQLMRHHWPIHCERESAYRLVQASGVGLSAE
jgi:hypothetical protein